MTMRFERVPPAGLTAVMVACQGLAVGPESQLPIGGQGVVYVRVCQSQVRQCCRAAKQLHTKLAHSWGAVVSRASFASKNASMHLNAVPCRTLAVPRARGRHSNARVVKAAQNSEGHRTCVCVKGRCASRRSKTPGGTCYGVSCR